jgi:hypothetical protein
VNDKLRKLGRAPVRVAAMPKEELSEVAELRYGKIGRKRSLFAFFANDTNTYRVSGL